MDDTQKQFERLIDNPTILRWVSDQVSGEQEVRDVMKALHTVINGHEHLTEWEKLPAQKSRGKAGRREVAERIARNAKQLAQDLEDLGTNVWGSNGLLPPSQVLSEVMSCWQELMGLRRRTIYREHFYLPHQLRRLSEHIQEPMIQRGRSARPNTCGADERVLARRLIEFFVET